ncbi:MAG: hypothetical protein N2Z63_04375 [Thiobacillaceae bacterium]|nr:hypothetical protein [Thiobacillaceae bacterium]
MSKSYLYTVHTRSGLSFHIEAETSAKPRHVPPHPVLARTLASRLRQALAEIEGVEPYRGPRHVAERRLLFRGEDFHNSN